MESSKIFRDRLSCYLENPEKAVQIAQTEDRIIQKPSNELREYLQSFVFKAKAYRYTYHVEKTKMAFQIKNDQISAETNPIELVLECLYHIVKNHSQEIEELPLVILYHARNTRNNQSLGLYIEPLPVVLRLKQDAATAAAKLEEEKRDLIRNGYSSEWLTTICSQAALWEMGNKIPGINIRIHDGENEMFAEDDILDSKKNENGLEFTLFSMSADIFDNGIIIRCMVEKQKEQEINRHLTSL